jgi:DNA damage-binding protein 1
MQLLSIYHSKSSITIATGTLTQIIYIISGGEIIYLELNVQTKCLELYSSVTLDQDIACLSMTPLSSYNFYNSNSNDNNNNNNNDIKVLTKSYMLAVGMWTDDTVRLLSLPSLIEINRIQLQIEDIQARDVLLVELECISYLMIGLGDGRLITYNIEYNSSNSIKDSSSSGSGSSSSNNIDNDSNSNSPMNQNRTNGNQQLPTDQQLPIVTNRRCGVIGKHAVTFNCFYNQKKLCIFATCDHPTIIYSKNNKLLFSIIDSKQHDEFICMTPFHCELFPESLALCSESSLVIGMIDTVQKVRNKSLCLLLVFNFDSIFFCLNYAIYHNFGCNDICHAADDGNDDDDGDDDKKMMMMMIKMMMMMMMMKK